MSTFTVDASSVPTAVRSGSCQTASPETSPADPAEQRRLRALASYAVLDTLPEAAFDDLTALAAHLCVAPMAFVTLVDFDRQWFKSRHGSTLTQTPREHSFCAHALKGVDVLVVPDTRQDSRFLTNPLVTGEPHLRFYAGAPLINADGHALGTLCVLDTAARALTDLQRNHLIVLAAQVLSQLELRRQARQLASEVATRQDALTELRETQRMLDGVLGHTDVLIYAKDVDGRFVMTNPAIEQATQIEGGLLGHTDHELFPAQLADDYRRNDIKIMETRQRQVFSEDLVQADGTVHTYRSTKFPLVDDRGAVIGIGGVSTDVTELAAARAAHEEAEQRWRAMVEQSPVAVTVISADGYVTYANAQTVALCGAITAAQIEGRPALDFVADAAREATSSMLDGVRTGGPLHAQEWVLRRLDGTEITVEFSAVGVHHQGTEAVQVELRDITAAAAAHATLRQIASTDPLTGSLNRRAWQDQLQILLGDANDAPLTIAVLDLDNFKAYNDTHGHDAGDAILQHFTQSTRGALRDDDVFARWGGEEFILALPNTTPAEAARVLDQIRTNVPEAQTCSIGYTTWRPAEPLSDTVTRADQALYQAKRLGRDRLARA